MLHKWPYWISALIVGLIAISYSKLIVLAEAFAAKILHTAPEYLLLLSPLFFLGSWALVYFFAPEAKGSGIPQVMAAVELIEKNNDNRSVDKFLGIKIALVKIGSSILSLLGGGAIGREGPTLQISASVFYYASKRFNFFKKYIQSETWIITGAAAGLAAAFNTPLGGLVYAIEELATQHINKFKTSLIAAVIIAGYSSQMIAGPYLYLGYPTLERFDIKSVHFVILIGVICGLAGAMFGKILFSLNSRKLKNFKTKKAFAFVAMFCGLTTALFAIYVDHRIMGSGKELMIEMLFKNNSVEWYVPIIRFFAPILTYLAGGAGGIFAPSLAAGGTLGHLIAELTASPDLHLYTLLGMIAFLTGVTRAPFTAFILVLEMTDRHAVIFPMMLAALFANNVAKLVGQRSFYELMKESYLPKSEG